MDAGCWFWQAKGCGLREKDRFAVFGYLGVLDTRDFGVIGTLFDMRNDAYRTDQIFIIKVTE